MIAFYERRTFQHIKRVRMCLSALAAVTAYGDALNERARTHDLSKYGQEERLPYIWLTEFHRCRQIGEPFDYPVGMHDRVRVAIEHHVTSNRHHPDFHADPNDMSEIDLIEMICDWTAMAQEFQQDAGTARAWADKTVGTRVHFNDNNRQFIYRMIDLLDRQLGSA